MSRQRKIIDRFYNDFKSSFVDHIATQRPEDFVNFIHAEYGEESILAHDDFNHWMYNQNKSNRQFHCVQDDQIVGQQAALGASVVVDGKKLNAAFAIDLMVNDEWKMKGLGVALMGALLNSYDLIIGIGVSQDAHKMFLRQGWHDLGKSDYFIKPMRCGALIESWKIASWFKNIKLIAAAIVSKLTDRFNASTIEAVELKLLNTREDFSRIKFLATQANSSIFVERDINYLQWRYFDFPGEQAYQVYLVHKQQHQLPGYLAVKLAEWKGKRALLVSDLEAEAQHTNHFVSAVIQLAQQEKVDVILYHGVNSELAEALAKFRFYERPYGDIFVIYSNDTSLVDKLTDKGRWKIKFSDSDADTCYY